MKKRYMFLIPAFMLSSSLQAQTLEKMSWFNEPARWSVESDRLTMKVTPHTDYWRISHYDLLLMMLRFIMENTEVNLRLK